MEQLRDTTDVANMEVENVKDQLRQHQQAAAEVEKENIQLKDKLLHADISMAQVNSMLMLYFCSTCPSTLPSLTE